MNHSNLKTGHLKSSAKPNVQKSFESKRTFGAQDVGALIHNLLRETYPAEKSLKARLFLNWSDIVGHKLSALCFPSQLRDSCLVVLCRRSYALEVQHMSSHLIDAVNLYFGKALVTRLKIKVHKL